MSNSDDSFSPDDLDLNVGQLKIWLTDKELAEQYSALFPDTSKGKK